MSKIKYLFRRIINIDYKNFFNVINKVHHKNKKNRIFIFFDVVYCGIVYQAGYTDYYLFAMDEMNHNERKTVVTRGKNNEMIKKLNNKEYTKFFNDKVLFNYKFAKFLNRDWLYVDKNYDQFVGFIKNKKELFLKPISLQCGKGIEKITISNYTPKELYKYIMNNKKMLIEEGAEQHKKMSALHPNSINTIRVVTINNKGKVTIVAAFLRIGNNNKVVDNFNNGGLCAKVEVNNGKILYKALDKNNHLYSKHPLTNVSIVGFQIPMWNSVRKMVVEAAKVVPEVGYVGWDVCISPTKPLLIEANEFPGHDVYQLPPHRKNNQGLLPEFKKALDK